MSEAEQQEQQPQPSMSKMTTLEAMAAKKQELAAKMEEMNRLVREHAKLMELEQERILKEQEDDKRRQQAAERKRKRAEEEERRKRAMEKKKQEEKDKREKLKKEQEEKVRKQKEIADKKHAEEQERIRAKEEKRLKLEKEQEEKEKKEEEQRQQQLKKDQEEKEEQQRQQQLKKDQEEKEEKEQQQRQQQQQEEEQEKTKEAVQGEVTALCKELWRRRAAIEESAIIRVPVGPHKVDEVTGYKVQKVQFPARKAASVVPRLTEEMILLAPQNRSERALLGQLVMSGMLLSAPVGTKNGDEMRQQAHFSFHKSRLPFKRRAIQRVVRLREAAPLQQPAAPLQQLVPLQEPALPLQAGPDPATYPAAGPAAEASQGPVQP
jgi:chemotaxis protein histidine kinase CheA